MRMTKYIVTISLILSILVSGSRFVVSAAVGVQPGQWAKYSASVYGQEISSLTVTVTSVSGDTVYYSLKIEYPGGITQTTSYQGDVSDGDTFPYIISANLDQGDYIYRTYYESLQVESVATRSYAGAARTVVSATRYGTTYYWDQQSGIMAEETWGTGMMTSSYTLTQTNIWSGSVFDMSSPLFWIILIIIIVVIVVVIVVVVLLIMRKKRRRAMEKAAVPPPAPTPPTTPAPTLVEKSASTKYCLKCGASLPLEAKFCPKCGSTQPEG
jgi:ribosomal protein L40E